jgi:uncharacterized protein (DUF305 family)
MTYLPRPFGAALLLCLLAAPACSPKPADVAPAPAAAGPSPTRDAAPRGGARVVQPGAPGEGTRVLELTDLAAPSPPWTDADVRFMRGMIPHHAQALDMAALVRERTENEDIRLLAQRIEISQKDEIATMRRWLQGRGLEPPGEHAHHMMGDHALMPGMLTSGQMGRLTAARGAEFDRLFLEYMIEHHQGALTMVKELFASPRAGQESEMYFFASHVDADQQIEIERMTRMLAER